MELGCVVPTLNPPVVEDGMVTDDLLFRYYRHRRGVSLLVKDGVVTATQFPDQEGLDAYDYVYLGGHIYEISDAEATVLTAAGYGGYLS